MFKSIRWRLQVWHALVLLLVLSSFGGVLYAQIRFARLREIDRELEGAAQALMGRLHGRGRGQPWFPEREWPGPGPRPGPVPGENGPWRPPYEPFVPPERRDRQWELPPPFRNRFGNSDETRPYFVLWRRDGEVLQTSHAPADLPLPAPSGEPSDRPQPARFRQRGEFRETILTGPFGLQVLVGRSIRAEFDQFRQLAFLLAATGTGVLGVGLAGGWLFSKRAVMPITTMSATAEAISASNLSQRIDVAETDSELGSLACVLNAMFARLESAFQRQVRFTADASHELRTPVAIILADTDLALAKERSAEEYRQTVETCHRAARRMKALVDALLTLARIDSGELVLRRDRVDLGQLVEECVDLIRPLASQKRVQLEVETTAATILGDSEQIARVIMNLATNAVHYNRDGGRVRLAVTEADGQVLLSVSDTGMGIPQEDQEHIFERFFRVDKARSRELGGSGLGLAICQSIVQAHGGKISFVSEADVGTTFEVRFPAQPFDSPL